MKKLSVRSRCSEKHKPFAQCKIDDSRTGILMEELKCKLTGGTPHKHYGFLFTCCNYENNCIKSTDKRSDYFDSINLNPAVTQCKYTIKLRNRNVCQVRLDFEELVLAGTTAVTLPSETNKQVYLCTTDELRVGPSFYGIPLLCGNNSNQHVYVHVNQSDDHVNAITLEINMANRLTTLNLLKPSWKIKFTQLECPLKKHRFDISKFSDIDEIANDFSLLAPQGVIQYFRGHSGEIRSFGYNDTTTSSYLSYPYSEYYAIGFHRPNYVCGIKFTPVYLNLYKDSTGCVHYLYIPELVYGDSSKNSVSSTGGVCSADTSTIFYSFVPGPFYIHFKAIGTTADTKPTQNQGFVIKYELITC
ncbi:uncharacterized protein LOC115883484 [Sitophilus oryzae]|uniref:Uncharacterized protein LOC115883484 n=1 Tax=Sitophilus oryzae TaxID=7048 RepID=A0A6J2Y1P4_SITOR|nr:uncharacterized protein LOC115883484 [Sitophilus oryzae]